MSDLTLSRRGFLTSLFAASTIVLVEPKITYFLPPKEGWYSYSYEDLLKDFKHRFTYATFMSDLRGIDILLVEASAKELREYQTILGPQRMEKFKC
jgi:hypothetical protein